MGAEAATRLENFPLRKMVFTRPTGKMMPARLERDCFGWKWTQGLSKIRRWIVNDKHTPACAMRVFGFFGVAGFSLRLAASLFAGTAFFDVMVLARFVVDGLLLTIGIYL